MIFPYIIFLYIRLMPKRTISQKELRRMRRIVGKNLLNWRYRRRMTLHQLSLITGIDDRHLDAFEMGQRACTLDELYKLSEALKTSSMLMIVEGA